MDVACLIDILKKMGVPQSWYSINDRLSSDTYILNKVYDRWEYFYFDERGKKNGYKTLVLVRKCVGKTILPLNGLFLYLYCYGNNLRLSPSILPPSAA